MAGSLAGKRVLVTSGPTRGLIDAVRFITNRSSGRLGCRIAETALGRGAEVTLVAGAGSLKPERRHLTAAEAGRLRVVPVETVEDLVASLEDEMGAAPPAAVVHAMAVLDYAPAEEKAEKTPSGREEWTLRLTRNPKVIKRIRELAPDACLVQFKLEVGLSEEELRAAAMESLRKNRSDMVVANDLDRIRGASHPAVVLNAAGDVLARPDGKGAIARAICDALQGATHCRAGFSRPVR